MSIYWVYNYIDNKKYIMLKYIKIMSVFVFWYKNCLFGVWWFVCIEDCGGGGGLVYGFFVLFEEWFNVFFGGLV